MSRIVARDGCSPELASARLARQWSGTRKAAMANVVLCTLWDYSYTEQQLRRAWDRLGKEEERKTM